MSHVSNFTQLPEKILLDLINESNNASLTSDLVSVALKPAGVPTTKNTVATVSSREGSGYSGSLDLEYNRLQIQGFADLYYPAGFTLPLGDATTLADLLPELNAGLAINLIEDLDFEDQIIEAWEGIPNETKAIQVPILPTSMVYMGELEFILDGNDIPLGDLLASTILDGLNYPTKEDETPFALLFPDNQLNIY